MVVTKAAPEHEMKKRAALKAHRSPGGATAGPRRAPVGAATGSRRTGRGGPPARLRLHAPASALLALRERSLHTTRFNDRQ